MCAPWPPQYRAVGGAAWLACCAVCARGESWGGGGSRAGTPRSRPSVRVACLRALWCCVVLCGADWCRVAARVRAAAALHVGLVRWPTEVEDVYIIGGSRIHARLSFVGSHAVGPCVAFDCASWIRSHAVLRVVRFSLHLILDVSVGSYVQNLNHLRCARGAALRAPEAEPPTSAHTAPRAT
eukprot:7129618-Prymnesium_polylepis.1